MKVVIAAGIFPPDIGGPATSVPALADAWARDGHDVTVVTYSDAATDASDAARPYRVVRVPRSAPARVLSYLSSLWRAAGAARTVFAQDSLSSGLPAAIVCLLRRRRLVIKVVGDVAWERATERIGYAASVWDFQTDAGLPLRFRLMKALQRFAARRADTIIVPSKALIRLVTGWGVSERRVVQIYNGVEIPEEVSSAATRSHEILAAGRLIPLKRFDVLIAALSSVIRDVPDASLTIIGEGPEKARLEEKVRAAGMEGRVRFLGRATRDDICRRASACGAFALLSTHESFSHLLIEAGACGAPIVATRTGGNVEAVRDGENGLLVEVGDVGGTAAALTRLLKDPSLADGLARKAREDARMFSRVAWLRGTTDAVVGGGLRMVMVGRDGSMADPSSRGIARMRRYAGRLEALRIVVVARQQAETKRIDDKISVEVVDARNALLAVPRLSAAVTRGAREVRAGLIMAQDPFELAWAAIWAGKRTRTPVIVEEHGGVFLTDKWKMESPRNRLRMLLAPLVLRAASGFRAVSARIAEDLRRRAPGKPVCEVPVYTEPIDCQMSDVSGQKSDFGYVGRFVPQKNLEALMRAFAAIAREKPDTRLRMVGAGPLEDALKTLAADLGVGGRVDWRPFTEDVAEEYARIRTLVLPSWYEGWGRVVVEAMHCGIPVVMTDVGCAGEVLSDGVEGRVVPIGDEKALADAMRQTLDGAMHENMAQAASRRAASLETPDELADRLAAFWNQVIAL